MLWIEPITRLKSLQQTHYTVRKFCKCSHIIRVRITRWLTCREDFTMDAIFSPSLPWYSINLVDGTCAQLLPRAGFTSSSVFVSLTVLLTTCWYHQCLLINDTHKSKHTYTYTHKLNNMYTGMCTRTYMHNCYYTDMYAKTYIDACINIYTTCIHTYCTHTNIIKL